MLRATIICCCLLGCLALPAQELRVSMSSEGQDISSLLALCATMAEGEYRLEQAVAQRYASDLPGLLLLEEVPLTGAHQALANLLGCWWAYGPGGAVHFDDAGTLPLLEAPQTRVVNSLIDGDRGTLALCDRVMAPWTGHEECGLVFHQPAHRWMSRLDRDGFRQLRRLLDCIEHPGIDIPHHLPRLDRPRGLSATPAIEADDWHGLFTRLHAAGVPLSVTGAVLRQPPPDPLRLPACRVETLPLQLQTFGIAAAWIDGVLCVDLRGVREREHPAQNLRITRVPVAQFGSHLDCQAMLIRLRERCGGERWQDPGHVLEYLPRHRALLVACRDDLLFSLLAEIDRLDRGD